MVKRPSSGIRRIQVRVALASCAILALLVLVFFWLLPTSSLPADTSANSAGPRETLPNVSDAATGRAQPGTKPSPWPLFDIVPQQEPDLNVSLKLPDGWDNAVPVRVTIRPKDFDLEKHSEGQSIELTLGGDTHDAIAIHVPKDGVSVQVAGPSIVPLLGELRWVSTETLQFLSWFQLREREPALLDDPQFGAAIIPGQPHPTIVARSLELQRGSEYSLQVFPLVPVRVALLDENENEFDMPRSSSLFSASWHLPRETGAIHTYEGHLLRQRPVSEICWHVPAGANLVVSAGSTFEPSPMRVTIPAAPEGIRLKFKARYATLGRVRVISAGDGKPLGDAQFQFVSVVREAAAEPGVYSLLIQESSSQPDAESTIDVWAPGHYMEAIRKDAVPRDGTFLEIALRPSLPALVVRVDFDDGEAPPPVTIHVRVHFPHDHRNSNWRWTLVLPPEGKVVVYGNPPHIPFVQPQAAGFEFALVERGTEDGLPLRRFKARKQGGLLIRAVNAEGMEWGESVSVVISSALPASVLDPVAPLQTVNDGAGGTFSIDEKLFVPLKPGTWTVTMLSPKPTQLFGQETVELTEGIVELEVKPIARREWRELRILDSTGACRSAGTGFFSGAASLATMRSNLESDQSTMAKWARLDITSDDWYTSRLVRHVVAHKDGIVFAPSWFQGRVIVMPPVGDAFYEGLVDFDSGTVEVRVPEWGALVTFAPIDNVNEEQRAVLAEPGWFVAIREYRDVQDLHRVAGEDYKLRAVSGVATIASLPPGAYVAYYVRAREELVKHPQTGAETREVRLEWFDQVKFEARNDAVHVSLPATRR